MANTYELIAKVSLTSSTANIVFSNIPQTYDELILRFSGRSDGNSNWASVGFNSDTSTSTNWIGKYIRLYNQGNISQDVSDGTYAFQRYGNTASGYIADGFSNGEWRILGYTSTSLKKSIYGFSTINQNITTSTNNQTFIQVSEYTSNAAITTLSMFSHSGTNFVANSTAYLYGLK